jgi:hypothetical protein
MPPPEGCADSRLPDISHVGGLLSGRVDIRDTCGHINAAEELNDNTGTLICGKTPEGHVLNHREVELYGAKVPEYCILMFRVAVREEEPVSSRHVSVQMNSNLPANHELEPPDRCPDTRLPTPVLAVPASRESPTSSDAFDSAAGSLEPRFHGVRDRSNP